MYAVEFQQQCNHSYTMALAYFVMCCLVQVMPQLLNFLGLDTEDKHAPDWGTIVVYSCAASCNAPSSYTEEYVWVQPS